MSEKVMEKNSKTDREKVSLNSKVFSMVKAELYRQYRVQSHFKIYLYRFFAVLTSFEYAFLVLLFGVKAFFATNFPEEVLIAYMSLVFAQTIGGILLMVRYAFDSKKEIEIISALGTFSESDN